MEKCEQEIIDDFMTEFVNSYSTGVMWGQHGVRMELDKHVRRMVTEFYKKITNKKMNEKEMKDLIVENVELNLPEFVKGVKKASEDSNKIILMTNDAFGISPTETALLGRAIKYAGFHKVKIEII